MKKQLGIYLIIMLGMFFMTSCEKEELFENELSETETNAPLSLEKEDVVFNPKGDDSQMVISLDSLLATDTGATGAETRGQKVLIYTATKYINQGSWLPFVTASKSNLSQFKFYVKVTPNYGDPDVKAYRKSNNSYFFIRESINGSGSSDETFVQFSDLSNYVDKATLWVYGYSASSFTVQIFKEAVDSDNNNFTITPYNPSPSSGQVNQTNFFFKVKVPSGTSGATAMIDFKAPDGSIYPFSMTKSSIQFYLYKQLSQVGNYQVRYRVTKNGQTQTSNWFNVSVNGCDNLNIPFYKQPSGSAKCTQYCVRMVAKHLGYTYSESSDCNSRFNGNCPWSNNAEAATAINNLTNKTGHYAFNVSDAFLQNEICNNRPVLVTVKLYMNPNHNVNHMMVLVGMDNNYVYVNDPWKSNGKTYQYSRANFDTCFNGLGRIATYYR